MYVLIWSTFNMKSLNINVDLLKMVVRLEMWYNLPMSFFFFTHVSVPWSCWNKAPQTEWPKREIYSPTILEIWSQGVGGSCFPWRLWGGICSMLLSQPPLVVAGSPWCYLTYQAAPLQLSRLHRDSFPVYMCVYTALSFPLIIRIPAIGFKAHPNPVESHFCLIVSEKFLFPNKVACIELEIRTSTHPFNPPDLPSYYFYFYKGSTATGDSGWILGWLLSESVMFGQLIKNKNRISGFDAKFPIWYGNFLKLRNEAPSLMYQIIHDQYRDKIIVPGKWVFPSPLLLFIGTFTSEFFFVLNIYLLENFKLAIVSFFHLFILKGPWHPPATQVPWAEAFQHVWHKSVLIF